MESLSPVQTDATSLANNSQHCWMLHVASVCIPCAKFETGQTFQPTTPNISFVLWSPKRSATMLDPFPQLFQHCWGHARSFVASVCTPLPTRTQQLPTLLAQQCWELLRPFARSLILSSQPRDKVSILVDKTMQIFFAEFAQKKNEKFQVEGTAFLLFNQQAAATSTETSNSSCYASVQSKSRPSSPLGITSKGITRPKPLPAFILEPRASPRRRENEHNIFANGALGRDLTSLIHHRN